MLLSCFYFLFILSLGCFILAIRKLLKTPIFWLMILLMVCSGASEATMTQWASAFTESAVGVSKTIGDLAGPCLFATFMGIARMMYGKFSEKLKLQKVMLVCGILCAGNRGGSC